MRLATALSVTALLSGCIVPPHLGPASMPATADSFATSSSYSAPEAPWPSERWWESYGDAQLNGLIQEALSGAPTISQAEARLRRAEAIAEGARAPLVPSISADASITANKPSTEDGIPVLPARQGYHAYGRTTLGFSWELDFWGRNRAALAAARSESVAASADAAAARLLVSASVAAAYAELARLFADRAVLADTLEVRERSLALVSSRVRHGLDSDAELAQAEAGPPAARTDLASADEAIGITRNRIAALMGNGPDRGIAIQQPAAPALVSFGLPASLPANLLGRRPEVVAARWRVEAARGRERVARTQFYPSVNLLGFIGFDALGLGNLLNDGAGVGGAGPALNLPIFDGGRRRAGYRGARADYEAAVSSYNETVTQALREVADVAVSFRQLQAEREGADQAVASTERAYRLAQLRYRAGAADYQSVLVVEDRLLTRQRIAASLRTRAFILDVALVRALGGAGLQSGQAPGS